MRVHRDPLQRETTIKGINIVAVIKQIFLVGVMVKASGVIVVTLSPDKKERLHEQPPSRERTGVKLVSFEVTEFLRPDSSKQIFRMLDGLAPDKKEKVRMISHWWR